jgi:hypothetical protein
MSKKINQKFLEVDEWRVYDLPIQYGEEDYNDARFEIIQQAKKTPELAALFEYGYIPVPGISDMDFWAVFPNDAKSMYISTSPALSEKTKYLMKHQITLITEKHYKKLLFFDPWTTNVWPNGHKLLYKRDDIERGLNFQKLEFTKEELEVLSLTRVEEVLRSIHSAVSFYAKKELPIRDLFETLKSCTYVLREVNNITSQKINPSFSEDLQELMKNWFEIEQKEAIRKFVNIFHEGLLVSFKCSFALADWAKRHCKSENLNEIGVRKTGFLNKPSLDKGAQNVYVNTFGGRQVYSDVIKTPEQALEVSINSYKRAKINLGRRSKVIDFYIIFQPLGAAATHLGLVSENGLLSDSLKKNTFSNMEQAPVFRHKIFQEKVKMINEITEIYNEKQGVGGKGWLFGNNYFGYSFGKEKLRRKILTFYLGRKFWNRVGNLLY